MTPMPSPAAIHGIADASDWRSNFFWWIFGDIACTSAAMILLINLVFLGYVMQSEPREVQPYHPMMQQMPKSLWIKCFFSMAGQATQWVNNAIKPKSSCWRSGYPLVY